MKNRFVAQQASRTGGVKHQVQRGEIKFQHGRTMKTSKTNQVYNRANPRRSDRQMQKLMDQQMQNLD